MPRGPSPKKQETHDRIVRTAATALRRKGFAGVGVAEVMDEAGLTHGGFYAHFRDRDAMLVEALDAAAAHSLDRLGKVPEGVPPARALEALVDYYLSDRHVANVEGGCPAAALGADAARQGPEVKRVMTRRMKELADLFARQLPTWGEAAAHEDSLATLSALLGALIISRASDSPAFAAAVRGATKQLIARGVRHRRA